MPARLVTIGPSHYCEKARWALDRAGWRYDEKRHIPLLHWLATLPTARQRQVPILVTPHGTIGSSTGILEFVDRSLAEADRLFPDDATRSEVTEVARELDRRLGPATRRYAYFYLLQDPQLLVATLSAGMGPLPRAVAGMLRRPMSLGLKRGLKISPATAQKSKERILEIFDEMDRRLAANGGKYLVGARFTAADLTFASLASPVLLPPEFGSWLPNVEDVPPAYAELVTALRARPAGKLALRLFKEERRRGVAKGRS